MRGKQISVRLSDKEKKVYDTMKRDLAFSLEGQEIDAGSAASSSNKLQMANGAVYADDGSVAKIHDRKLDALEDVIEAANGKPVLIAYRYKHDLERILQRFPAEKLDSSDSIKRWNDGEIQLSGSTRHPPGMDLICRRAVPLPGLVWADMVVELYQQTNARLWRQGQKDTVVIHHIITKGTIDEQVMQALRLKDKNPDRFDRCGKSKP